VKQPTLYRYNKKPPKNRWSILVGAIPGGCPHEELNGPSIPCVQHLFWWYYRRNDIYFVPTRQRQCH